MRKIFLWPLGLIYGGFAALFRKIAEIKGRTKPKVFTVVVGNIAVGGTGKTPMIIQLCQALQTKGLSVGVLSRGYGRKTRGFYTVDQKSTAGEVGEEPLEIFRRTGVPVYVCENRLDGVRQMEQTFDILLLDDGFQHLPLKGHFNIILDNSKMPYYKNAVLPAGTLREFPYVLGEADILVFTKVKDSFNRQELERRTHSLGKPIFISSYKTKLPNLSTEKRYILVSALADNKALRKSLDKYTIVKQFSYPDHRSFSEQDHMKWKKAIQENEAEIITTGKDVSKIDQNLLGDNCVIHVLSSEHHFEKGGFESLIQLILTAKENA